MIVTRIRGGLGNQFFMYATGRALALRRKAELALDTEWYQTRPGPRRPFVLNRYPIQARQLLASERRWIQMCTTGNLKAFAFAHRWAQFKEQNFNEYYPSVTDLRGNIYLDGFWQFPDYFADCESVIRAELMPTAGVHEVDYAMVNRVKDVNSISIHVRRDDYLTSARFIGALPVAYYTSAIAWMVNRVENPHFFVFSDDPAWARANILIGGPVDYIAHDVEDSPFKDLHLMAQCHHHIIANSTFSWWAAWLSSSESPLVVAPMRWFAEVAPGNHSRLPTSWNAL
jgi:hypothetical protein